MITFTEPEVAMNGQYPVTETARLLGVHRTTLMRYVKSGLIKCSYRRTGRKFFYGREIVRCWKACI